jgi:hypothetical protein
MTRRRSDKRQTAELDAHLRQLYRTLVREPVPAWLLGTVEQLEQNEKARRAA